MAVVICDMSISLDGYVTGPNDSRENPFGTLASPITLERTQALITPAATHIGFRVIR
jgi:hypothetical protein